MRERRIPKEGKEEMLSKRIEMNGKEKGMKRSEFQ